MANPVHPYKKNHDIFEKSDGPMRDIETTIDDHAVTAETLLDRIRAALGQNDREEAQALCAQALELHPGHHQVQAMHGFILAGAGRIDEAIGAYRRATVLEPAYILAQHSLAVLLEASGRPAEALPALEAAVRLDPKLVDAQRRRIIILADLGQREAALAAAEAALAVLPGNHELRLAQSVALGRSGKPAEALAVLESILAETDATSPIHIQAQAEKGTALHALGRFAEAMAAFDAALELNENYIYALNGIGLAELGLGLNDAALAAFDRVLALDPGNRDAPLYRALTLEEMGRFDAALAAYREVLAKRPDTPLAHNNIGKIHRDVGRIGEAQASLRQSLAVDPNQPQVHSNLLLTMLYDPGLDAETLLAEHRRWGERFGHPPGRLTQWANDRDPERPLRIGFVSAEFGRHALANWLMAALKSLDRAAFTIVCYSTRKIEDAITERFKELASEWRRVVGMGNHELAALIRADAIDIVIDITGHAAYSRLPCLALKPAPVQASWLGYPFTTGLDAIDYSIMDPVAVREGEEHLFVEKVVRLPAGRFRFEPPDPSPPVAPPPALRNDCITFGSFNNLAKLSPEVLATWGRILGTVPNARLLLKSAALGNPVVADSIRTTVCAAGVGPERLEMRGQSDYATMLGEYADMDIALDPFPFGGGATSCEALWMGVPLVTLPSWQPVSRQTAGYLTALGREEWISSDLDDYIDRATTLAADPDHLARLRADQRQLMLASPLCDSALLGKELGTALRQMWREYVGV